MTQVMEIFTATSITFPLMVAVITTLVKATETCYGKLILKNIIKFYHFITCFLPVLGSYVQGSQPCFIQ